MPQPLRYRRCPECQVVLRASEFPRATGQTHAPGQLQSRRCPQCGFTGPLMAFALTERPAESDEEAPS